MKVLNLSLDKTILDKDSAVSARLLDYGKLVDKYVAIAPADKNTIIDLSEKVKIIGIRAGNKIKTLFMIYKTAREILTGEKGEKFDIITIQDQYYLALLGWILARKFKVGLELQIHGFEKYRGLRKIVAKFVIPRAGAIRCVSQRLKRLLISDFKAEEEKITTVPIYTNLKSQISKLKTDNSELKNGDNFIFLTVGRLEPVKNIGLQIKALAEIGEKYSEVELWIVGKGSEEEKLKSLTETLNIGDRVNFLGWQDSVGEFYMRADAFLLTSDSEGWGLAIIEAASYGLPIIMTDVGCAGEVIKNNESGLVVPIGDKEELKNAMIKVLEDGELRKKMGEQARSSIENLPSKEETLALYKKSWEKAVKTK